jgi:hypothetical protein
MSFAGKLNNNIHKKQKRRNTNHKCAGMCCGISFGTAQSAVAAADSGLQHKSGGKKNTQRKLETGPNE